MRRFLKRLVGWTKFHFNRVMIARPGLIAVLGRPLTVIDGFGTPGDTVLTAIVCRNLKLRHPALRINCITPNPAVLEADPNLDFLNRRQTFFHVRVWYLDVIDTKDGTSNILRDTFRKLGFPSFDYRSKVYLRRDEIREAEGLLKDLPKPFISINTKTREATKNWGENNWQSLVERVRGRGSLLHLGDSTEPDLPGVTRFAGKLSLRQSMALLSLVDIHVGGVSFLMHAANGLKVPSVIIYGGRETPMNSGYNENVNLYSAVACSPCWLHSSRGESCSRQMLCMHAISVEHVLHEVERLLSESACEAV